MVKPVRSSVQYGRIFEIILHSATDLQDVRKLGKMKVYARVSISEDPELEIETVVDKERKTSPRWDCKIKYMVAEEIIHDESTKVDIKLYCKRSLLEDKYLGEVNINLKSLFEKPRSGEIKSYEVVRGDSEGTSGKINLSYSFGEKAIFEKAIAKEPSKFVKILKGGAVILLQVVLGSLVGASLPANSNYELGRGDKLGGWKPQPIPSLKDVRIIQIASGGYHSLALTDKGEVLSWGHGGHGQLGHSSIQNQKVPLRIEVLANERVTNIACGGSSSAAITEEDKLYMWGNAKDSRLGIPGLHEVQSTPLQVQFLTEDDGSIIHGVLSVAIGASHALCLVTKSAC